MSWRNQIINKLPVDEAKMQGTPSSKLGEFALVVNTYANSKDPNKEGAIEIQLSESSAIKIAYPLSYSKRTLPVKGELVPTYYHSQLKTYFYGPPLNVHNYPNHNAVTNLVQETDSFAESNKVNPYALFQGDTILEGRSGQSIRFTQTLKESKSFWSQGKVDGESVIIISSGQEQIKNSIDLIMEHPDKDAALLVLLENGKLKYEGATEYEGNQALLISDRVHIKAREENVSLTANKEIELLDQKWQITLTEIVDLIDILVTGGNVIPNGVTGANAEAAIKLSKIKTRLANGN